jgi:hypothetical protein
VRQHRAHLHIKTFDKPLSLPVFMKYLFVFSGRQEIDRVGAARAGQNSATTSGVKIGSAGEK